jgi:hypothetical protein
VKYNYCPQCRKAYIRSHFERDSCMYCNSGCEVVDVKRNTLYYFGYAMLLIGAAGALVPRFAAVADRTPFLVFGAGLAVAGCVAVVMGTSRMAREAAESFEKSEK